MRSFLLFPLAVSATSVMALSNQEQRLSMLECKMQKVRGESVYECRNGAKFASGRPLTTGYNLSAFVDLLYWKFYQGGNDYAVNDDTVTRNISGSMKKFNFEWEPGYRIGASYGFSDQWDFTVSFAHMNTDSDVTKKAAAGGELEPVSPFGVAGANGFVEQRLKYSVFNFEMGSSYFVSRFLYLRPHFGAQGAWIHHKMRSSSSQYSVFNRFQNEFNGGGLRLGFDTKWFFAGQWNAVFNAAASALYGTSNVLMRENSTAGSYHIAADVSHVIPSVQSLIGLCWERNFDGDANHIALLLAYENTYWWRQNQFVGFENLPEIPPSGTRLSEDLGSQGLTFDFTLFF